MVSGRLVSIVFSALMTPPQTTPPAAISTYANPLDVKVADPCIIRHGGRYYLYGTAADPKQVDRGFPVWTSRNLIDWSYRGVALENTEGSWGQFWFWGPDVIAWRGRFLMFYGAFCEVDGRPVGRICLAESLGPLGPFRDVRAPVFDWGEGDVIDAHCFRDNDGRAYLFFTQAHRGNSIHVARLSRDLTRLDSQPLLAIEPSQPWEKQPINEGAFVTRRGSTYFLFYSGNDFRSPSYAVGLATAPSPLGPWTKHDGNPILAQRGPVAGPGCLGLIESPDDRETLAYYHTHLTPDGYVRQLAIDRARMSRDGEGRPVLHVDGPTWEPQPRPAGAAPGRAGTTDEFDESELDRERWMVVDEAPEDWRLRDGELAIRARGGDMWEGRGDYRNLFLQHAPAGDFEAIALVRFRGRANYEQAFLCVWQDADNYLRLSSVFADGPALQTGLERGGAYVGQSRPNPFGETVHLRVKKAGDVHECSASGDGADWVEVGEAMDVGFHDLKVGLGAISPGSGQVRAAAFESLRVEQAP